MQLLSKKNHTGWYGAICWNQLLLCSCARHFRMTTFAGQKVLKNVWRNLQSKRLRHLWPCRAVVNINKQKQETVQKSKIDLAIIIIRHFALLRAQNSFVFASGALAFLSSNAGCALSVDKYDLVRSLDQDEAATQSWHWDAGCALSVDAYLDEAATQSWRWDDGCAFSVDGYDLVLSLDEAATQSWHCDDGCALEAARAQSWRRCWSWDSGANDLSILLSAEATSRVDKDPVETKQSSLFPIQCLQILFSLQFGSAPIWFGWSQTKLVAWLNLEEIFDVSKIHGAEPTCSWLPSDDPEGWNSGVWPWCFHIFLSNILDKIHGTTAKDHLDKIHRHFGTEVSLAQFWSLADSSR